MKNDIIILPTLGHFTPYLFTLYEVQLSTYSVDRLRLHLGTKKNTYSSGSIGDVHNL